MRIIAGALVLTALISIITFDHAPGWGVFLLSVCSAVLGALLPDLAAQPGRVGPDPVHAAALAAAGLMVSAAFGRGLRVGFLLIAPVLWWTNLAFWLGWVVLGFLAAGDLVRSAWTAAAYVLFLGLAASWFAGFSADAETHGAARKAAELYFLGVNLLLSAGWLLRGA